jgi:hypothetical protein
MARRWQIATISLADALPPKKRRNPSSCSYWGFVLCLRHSHIISLLHIIYHMLWLKSSIPCFFTNIHFGWFERLLIPTESLFYQNPWLSHRDSDLCNVSLSYIAKRIWINSVYTVHCKTFCIIYLSTGILYVEYKIKTIFL